MSFLKNKFIIIVVIAIVLGGITGLYIAKMKKTEQAQMQTGSTGSGASTEKIGEVMQKLNDLTKE